MIIKGRYDHEALISLGANFVRYDSDSDGTEVRPDISMAGYQAALLAQVRADKRSELVAVRNDAILSGFPYLGKQIDSDRDSVMSITGAAVAALAAKAAGLPYAVVWTCADDSTIELDADGVLGMAVTLAMFADAQHEKARPLKDAIAAEKDAEKIKQVKW